MMRDAIFPSERHGVAGCGVIGSARVLALGLASRQVTVNALCPGWAAITGRTCNVCGGQVLDEGHAIAAN
jgi:NAD(P)-dependent dehydrogenase (short-subunit alcohol dehydrogenase family)